MNGSGALLTKYARGQTTRSGMAWLAVFAVVELALVYGLVHVESTSLAVLLVLPLVALVVLPLIRPSVIFVLSCACFLAAGSWLSTSATPTIVLRAASVALLALLAIKGRNEGIDRLSNLARPMVAFSVLTWAMLTYISIVHSEFVTFLNSSLGAIALLLFAVVPLRSLSPRQLRKLLQGVLVAFLGASIVTGLVYPSQGIVNSRLTGLAANANLLAFYAVLAMAIPLLSGQRARSLVPPMLVGIPVLVMTASRTSAAALLVLVFLAAVSGVALTRKFAAVALCGLVLLVLSPGFSLAEVDLLRRNNSRQGSVTESLNVFAASPITGVGLHGIDQWITSSPLLALAAGGIVGTLVLAVNVAALVRNSYRVGIATGALGVAAVVHSLGESWMMSTSGPMMAFFVMTWTVVALNERTQNDKVMALSHAA